MNTRKTHKKCARCGETKKSAENFRVMPSGQKYQICNSCVQDPIKKEKLKCKSCYKSKTKNCFTKSDNICNHCFDNPKQTVSVKKNKKDDMVIDRNVMSFEYQNKQRLSAEQALEKAKKQNEENLKSGKYKAVAYGTKNVPLNMARSIILKRV